jgi:hypothetical protein
MAQMLVVVPRVTGLGHNRGTMTMHSFIVGAVYVLVVITPCVIALLSSADRNEDSESDVLRDGFI